MLKNIFILTAMLMVVHQANALPEAKSVQTSLTGRITNESTGEPLPGAVIYLPDLKRGTLAGSDGTYRIDRLPSARLLIQVSSLGFRSFTGMVDPGIAGEKNFALKKSVTEIAEVVVTGQPGVTEQKRTPAPIEIVPHSQLMQTASSNVIDAISTVPGVSQITTGSGISKPVIRGLGYNRLIVLHQGIRQEGQQWGDEHGTEIDSYDVDHVEILKGPASLLYGSDAMAGVINFLPSPVLPDGSVKGDISSNYQSNNGLAGYSVHVAGNRQGLIWEARYSGKFAHAYENKYDGPVYNSGFREQAGSLLLGVNRSWGFSHLNFSRYHLTPGMIGGERNSDGEFLKVTSDAAGGQQKVPATTRDFKSYQPDPPFQKITHLKATWNNSIYLGNGNLRATLGLQQNKRKEFSRLDEYGLYFLLNTLNYDLKYRFPEMGGWKLTTGINGMWQRSGNKGPEFLIPAYHLFDWGVFSVANRGWGDFDISGGLRVDRRSERIDALFVNSDGEKVSPADPQAVERFSAQDKSFTGFSGSLGFTWQISETIHSRFNLSRGFRAPNIAELGSNGEHEGTFRYETGNPDLKPETSLQLDLGFGLNTDHLSASLNLFRNSVDHYIFSHKLNAVAGGDSLYDELPVFRFTAGKALLTGGEFSLDIHPHPLDWLHFENSFSYTRGILKNQPDSSHYLPQMPAPRWIAEVRADVEHVNRFVRNGYLKVVMDHNLTQDHFYAAYGSETRTPAYTLFHIGAGADFTSGRKTLFSVNVTVNNLTNAAYQNHLSRLKYAPVNPETGRQGIYNMGRNVSFVLRIPVSFAE
ncbi:MAG: TonB-dependent receptor [Mangrovibacterium sp.]